VVRRRLREPFATAWGTVSERELVLVRLEDGSGAAGFGEAAPLAGYGSGLEEVLAGLERAREVLAGADSDGARERLSGVSMTPEALAALDLALWDLSCRRVEAPLWRRLGAASAPEVLVNATLAGSAAAEARRFRAAGVRCIKVKVGLGDDFERIAAVRAAVGRDAALRIDANGAWSVEEAVAALASFERFEIELCEEPVHGLEAIARVASATAVPIAMDESAALEGALTRRVCDAACLKVARCGGISGLLSTAARAREAGYRVYLASTLDGPLGIAAALHAAAVVRPELSCGLATLSMFARAHPLGALAARLRPPPGPGLGAGLVEWYR
jgi:L-alanine-DL-glutamate epimerase-like enolase superfamily enzyme